MVEQILDRYQIDYVFFGTSERNTYGAQGEQKFEENLDAICDFDGSRFYQVGVCRASLAKRNLCSSRLLHLTLRRLRG